MENALFDAPGRGRNAEIKPFRIKYYCENRDPDFDAKIHNVLLVYKQLSIQFDENGELQPFCDGQVTHVLSFDEKPGIQAIATTSQDLLPDADHGFISHDNEYKRLGTLSLPAGIDLQTGEAFPLVSESHNSRDYIRFLAQHGRRLFQQNDKTDAPWYPREEQRGTCRTHLSLLQRGQRRTRGIPLEIQS